MNYTGKLSDEELLKALENTKETKEVPKSSEVLRFIDAFKMDKGSYEIGSKFMYDLYRKWSAKPLDQRGFAKEFNNYFKPRSSFHKMIYDLNLNPKEFESLRAGKNKYKTDKTKSPHYKQHFELFLNRFDIKKGTLYIKIPVLYDLYDKWHYTNFKKKNNTITPLLFNEFLRLYFNYKMDHMNYYFGIDKMILNHLTDEQRLQCLSQKGQNNVRKKENKKKSN